MVFFYKTLEQVVYYIKNSSDSTSAARRPSSVEQASTNNDIIPPGWCGVLETSAAPRRRWDGRAAAEPVVGLAGRAGQVRKV
jgi:hypothetical protein